MAIQRNVRVVGVCAQEPGPEVFVAARGEDLVIVPLRPFLLDVGVDGDGDSLGVTLDARVEARVVTIAASTGV